VGRSPFENGSRDRREPHAEEPVGQKLLSQRRTNCLSLFHAIHLRPTRFPIRSILQAAFRLAGKRRHAGAEKA